MTMEGLPHPEDIGIVRKTAAERLKATRRAEKEARDADATKKKVAAVAPKSRGFFARLSGRPQEAAVPTATAAVELHARARTERTAVRGEIERVKAEHDRVLIGIEGDVSTEQDRIRWFAQRERLANTVPVATDAFINRSKNEYSAPWLSREIVQNFIDANREHPGTLDGVTIERKEISDSNGAVRFTITGQWPFEDYTGLISLHSQKDEGVEKKSAGGNGIGLKQTVLRYLRDFGVRRFEVRGDGWDVKYGMLPAERVNASIATAVKKAGREDTPEAMRHDWLVGEVHKTENRSSTSYVIETDNPEVIATLSSLRDVGAGKENRFLKDPDFENSHGRIKWIPAKEGGQQGRLYINGQVMHYESKGKSPETYWDASRFVTIQLNNVDYRMSIDRPPVTNFDLQKYTRSMVEAMTGEQLMDQLRRSKPIWSELPDDIFSHEAANVLLDEMVRSLTIRHKDAFKANEYATVFGSEKLLTRDTTLTVQQEQDLRDRGYLLCPRFFSRLGMPLASSRLNAFEAAAQQRPDIFKADREHDRLAAETGVGVGYERLLSDTPEAFFNTMVTRFTEICGKKPLLSLAEGKLRISVPIEVSKEIFSDFLSQPRTPAELAMLFARGIAAYMYEKGFGSGTLLSGPEHVVTFAFKKATLEDYTYISLYARVLNAGREDGSRDLILQLDMPSQYEKAVAQFMEKQAPAVPDAPLVPSAEAQLAESVLATEAVPGHRPSGTADLKPLTSGPAGKPAVVLEGGRAEPGPEPESRSRALSDDELATAEAAVPGITALVNKLTAAVSRVVEEREAPSVATAVESAGSGAFENVYVDGREIKDIVEGNNRVEVSARTVPHEEESVLHSDLARLQKRLGEIINVLSPEDTIEGFEIVAEPTKQQLEQLSLLRIIAHQLLGSIELKNRLFAFRGRGATGVNIPVEGGNVIGLHEGLFKQDFLEALQSFTHELAHNNIRKHDDKFIRTEEALFTQSQAALLAVIRALRRGEQLSKDQEQLLEVQEKWDALRGQV